MSDGRIVHQADFEEANNHVKLAVGILQRSKNAELAAAANSAARISRPNKKRVDEMIAAGNNERAARDVLIVLLPKLINAQFIAVPYRQTLERLHDEIQGIARMVRA